MAEHASFLTLPPELRNQIYHLLFPTPSQAEIGAPSTLHPRPITYSSLESFGQDTFYSSLPASTPTNSKFLLTCRQFHNETHLLYLANTQFHITGRYTDPCAFRSQLARLQPPKSTSVRHIVLIAKISHLRALNESWCGLPFGNPELHLETLTIVPKKPGTEYSAYAEVADLSQSHTLAYVLAETLKTLKNVQRVVVRNDGCFTDVVWKLVYRSLVYRLWRWGGGLCGLGFRELKDEYAFEIMSSYGMTAKSIDEGWRSVPEELNRLIGAEGSRDGMPDDVGL